MENEKSKKRWRYKRPPIIYVEGIDGSGKTTQTKLLVDWLRQYRVPVKRFFRPWNNAIGRLIRSYTYDDSVPGNVKAALFAADAMLVNQQMREYQSQGTGSVCDRSGLTTHVYQEAEGCDPKWLEAIVPHDPVSCLIYLKLDPETAMRRIIEERKEQVSVFETRDFLDKVSTGYERRINDNEFLLHRTHVVDTSEKSIEDVANEIREIVTDMWLSDVS